MPKPVIWSPSAEKDFELILNYLEKNWSNQVVQSFIEITDKMINQISINPKLFPIIFRKERIRKCILTEHNAVFYRERRSYIDILRLFDVRQNSKTLKFS